MICQNSLTSKTALFYRLVSHIHRLQDTFKAHLEPNSRELDIHNFIELLNIYLMECMEELDLSFSDN